MSSHSLEVFPSFCEYSEIESLADWVRSFKGWMFNYHENRGQIEMADSKFGDRTLAQPWILPIVIISGLASAYAIPWSYTNISAFDIAATLIPMIAQFALACLTSVFAFLGKQVWLPSLIATTSLSLANALLYGMNFWGVQLPTLPKSLIIITAISLIPTLIWGRKKVQYSAPNTQNFDTTNGGDW